MNDNEITINRHPAVAGQFYPANPDVLQKELSTLFAEAAPKQYEHVRAIISPHAGYVFSGKIAASAFNQIDNSVEWKRVFLIASSHQSRFEGASVYCDGDFIMPYGKEVVDTELGKTLVELYPELFSDDRSPHLNEHSIEVQLPFLHYVLKGKYKIVPIILGTSKPPVCKRIALALKPYLNEDNLFVISSDFSHYPSYENAKSVDLATKQAIVSNKPDQLLSVLTENTRKHIPNLATSLCGWTSVLTLLYMTEDEDQFIYQGINYSNSGDVRNYGERDQVVGYWSIVLMGKKEDAREFHLTDTEKELLLQEARKSVEKLFRKVEPPLLNIQDCSATLKTKCGAFVSLHNQGKLRGCFGHMEKDKPLIQNVHEMAVWAAKRDSRFVPVSEEELEDIDIEISVLSPLRKIKDIAEIKLGVHGIFIVKGFYRGVFLPQVATETGWDMENYLGHCARDKAGIGWDGWKNADIYIFTATVFGEKE